MQSSKKIAVIVLCLSLFLIIPASSAHVPILPSGNNSLSAATNVDNPQKSWVVYSTIQASGTTDYFKMNFSAGDQIYLMLLKSTSASSAGFNPELILMGPSMGTTGPLPPGINVPDGYGYMAILPSSSAEAEYEPFGPDSFYDLANVTMSAPSTGTYYVAVYSSTTGNYGLAIGMQEAYSVVEWVTLPFYLVYVYQWVGEPLLLVLAPVIATTLTGAAALYVGRRRNTSKSGIAYWSGGISGMLFLGSGFSTILQMLINLSRTGMESSGLITLGLAAMPLAVGLAIIWITLRKKRTGLAGSIGFGVLGIVGLFALGGYFIGPILAVIAAISPKRRD